MICICYAVKNYFSEETLHLNGRHWCAVRRWTVIPILATPFRKRRNWPKWKWQLQATLQLSFSAWTIEKWATFKFIIIALVYALVYLRPQQVIVMRSKFEFKMPHNSRKSRYPTSGALRSRKVTRITVQIFNGQSYMNSQTIKLRNRTWKSGAILTNTRANTTGYEKTCLF